MINSQQKILKLNYVYPVSILLISFSTYLIRILGPEPYKNLQNNLVSIEGLTVIEKRDQYIFFSWLFISFILFALTILKFQFRIKFKLSNQLVFLLFLAAISLTLLSTLWPYDLHKVLTGISLWSGVDPLALITGFILSWFLFRYISIYSLKFNNLINILLYLLLFIYILPNLIQIPKYLDDQNHFNFLVNDLIVVSLGKTVLYDYFPVYTNLLGIPLAPLLQLSPTHPIQISVYYLIFLQGLIILISFLMLRQSILKRLLPLSFIISVVPLFAAGDIGRSAISYFPIFPIRIIIPVICIFLALKLILAKDIKKFTFIFIGFCLGLNIFNNIEFGLTSSFAIVLATGLVLYKTKFFYRFLIESMLGVVSFLLLFYLVFLTLGKPLDFSKLFVFIQLTLSGFYAVPMDAMGIHIIIVSLFVTGSVVSANILINSTFTRSLILKRNYLLFIFSFWSIISLPYFIGRSFPSTIIGGFAFQSGIIFSLLIPTLFNLNRLLKFNTIHKFKLTIFGFMGLSIILSLLFAINNPKDKITKIFDYNSESSDYLKLKSDIRYYLNDSQDKSLIDLFQNKSISQILPLSGALESQLNFPSELITNHPWHLEVTPLYTSLQCEYSMKSNYKYVLTTLPLMNSLFSNKNCLGVFDFKKATMLSEIDTKFVIVPKY